MLERKPWPVSIRNGMLMVRLFLFPMLSFDFNATIRKQIRWGSIFMKQDPMLFLNAWKSDGCCGHARRAAAPQAHGLRPCDRHCTTARCCIGRGLRQTGCEWWVWENSEGVTCVTTWKDRSFVMYDSKFDFTNSNRRWEWFENRN